MKQATWGLFILLLCSAPLAVAQDPANQTQNQVDPLAAAARRAREAKKSQTAPKKVWTNDDIPKTGDGISIIGPEASAPDQAKQSATAPSKDASKTTDEKAGPEDTKKKADDIKSQLDAAKDELQTQQSDLDILQRKLALDKQTYYGKPDYSSDPQGATNLNNEQDQIDAKQAEIGEIQKKIEELQQKLPQDTDAAADKGNTSQ